MRPFPVLRSIGFFCLLSALAEALAFGAVRQDVKIRVRLHEAIPMVRVRGFDLKFNDDRLEGNRGRKTRGFSALPGRGAGGASEWEVRCHVDRIRAVPIGRPGETLDLPSPATLTTPAGFFQVGGRPYREELRIFAAGSLCEVVNSVDLEKYLNGLVNAEFSSKWNEEAVEAQVVAARSYAYFQIQKSKKLHFDVDATVRDQVYDGSVREDPRAERIVARTRGLVLTVGGSRRPMPLKAFYHSTCAGRTELPEQVWGNPFPGFRHQVKCPFCASSPVLHWELEVSAEELARRFRHRALAQGLRPRVRPGEAPPQGWERALRAGKLVDLRIEGWDSGGRASTVVAEWSIPGSWQRVKFSISGARFRDWMGSGRFRSAAFEITQAPRSSYSHGSSHGSWRFKGRGYGHGVGMCQYGAKVMGERGYQMASILRHYYPDAVIRKLW